MELPGGEDQSDQVDEGSDPAVGGRLQQRHAKYCDSGDSEFQCQLTNLLPGGRPCPQQRRTRWGRSNVPQRPSPPPEPHCGCRRTLPSGPGREEGQSRDINGARDSGVG